MTAGNGSGAAELPTTTAPKNADDSVLPVGNLLEAVAKAATENAQSASPEHLRAWAEVIVGVLSTPAVANVVHAWGAAQQAEAMAKVELAKQQGANANAAHERQSKIATTFLVSLAALGVAGMAAIATIAGFRVMEPQALAVLASTFFTALFGTGIYGTALRSHDNS